MPTRDGLRDVLGVAACLAIACILPACRRETRQFTGPAYTNADALGVRVDADAAAEHAALPAPGTPSPYRGNAWGMSQGQQLWAQMNCVGCHSHGGGGMGPPLMDNKWLYGADDASIFTTITEGRPNGMPAFRGRLSDQQVWELVSYVKSLSGWANQQAESPRDDHMAIRPGTSLTETHPIVKQEQP
jgi:cytochrome c oxidase cbb3-type subunit 3